MKPFYAGTNVEANLIERRTLTTKQSEVRKQLISTLEKRGYSVEEIAGPWMKVTRPQTHPDYTVQLEVEPEGSNLDIVLLSDYTKALTSEFPLGGSFAISSTVKLTEDNVDFAADRIASFFGEINEEDVNTVRTWEYVQQNLRWEDQMRKNSK